MKTVTLTERLTCVKTVTFILEVPVNTYKERLVEDVSRDKLKVITLTPTE